MKEGLRPFPCCFRYFLTGQGGGKRQKTSKHLKQRGLVVVPKYGFITVGPDRNKPDGYTGFLF